MRVLTFLREGRPKSCAFCSPIKSNVRFQTSNSLAPRIRLNTKMMQKLKSLQILALAIILSPIAYSPALAQKTPLACQVEAAAGLSWENGRWVASRYNSDVKFLLVLDGATLTLESAAKVLGSISATCRSAFDGRIECSDDVGGRIEFSPLKLRGTVAQLLGGTLDSPTTRDSISVRPFACQKF